MGTSKQRGTGFDLYRAAVFMLAGLLFPAIGQAGAQSIEISVLDTQYSTELHLFERTLAGAATSTTRTTNSSAAPISDSVQGSIPINYARASADMFSLSTATSATKGATSASPPDYPDYSFTRATAQSVLTFSTMDDAVGSLSFSMLVAGDPSFEGFVSLRDITSNQSLFSYTLGQFSYTFREGLQGLLEPGIQLFGSHLYELTTHLSTNANGDFQDASLMASGIHAYVAPIPEPATYAMVLAGLVMVGFAGRYKSLLKGWNDIVAGGQKAPCDATSEVAHFHRHPALRA